MRDVFNGGVQSVVVKVEGESNGWATGDEAGNCGIDTKKGANTRRVEVAGNVSRVVRKAEVRAHPER